jgi:hypothetical protein
VPGRRRRVDRLLADPRAISSAGRAPPRQGGGHWFEPSIAHRLRPCVYRAVRVFQDLVGSNLVAIVAPPGGPVGGVEVCAAGVDLCRTRADVLEAGRSSLQALSPRLSCGWLLEGAGEGPGREDWLWDQDSRGRRRGALAARWEAISGGAAPRNRPRRRSWAVGDPSLPWWAALEAGVCPLKGARAAPAPGSTCETAERCGALDRHGVRFE